MDEDVCSDDARPKQSLAYLKARDPNMFHTRTMHAHKRACMHVCLLESSSMHAARRCNCPMAMS